jgi:hypothetical protein
MEPSLNLDVVVDHIRIVHLGETAEYLLNDVNGEAYRFVSRADDYGDYIVVLERWDAVRGQGPLSYTCSWFCSQAVFPSVNLLHEHIRFLPRGLLPQGLALRPMAWLPSSGV